MAHSGKGEARRIRVATYNIHKCKGLDGAVRPQRIADVLSEIDADIVALQEVVGPEDAVSTEDQANFLAAHSGYECFLGENRKWKGSAYGNLLLSRFPVKAATNHDITVLGREERGCLRADIEVDEYRLHVFNVHLGTGFRERRDQGRQLLAAEILKNAALDGPRLVMGDFNEWAPGLATRMLREEFQIAPLQKAAVRRRSYPGILPLLRLDEIYADPEMELQNLRLHRTKLALVASDHLPLVAEFCIAPVRPGGEQPAP